jgi:hypothetical protein
LRYVNIHIHTNLTDLTNMSTKIDTPDFLSAAYEASQPDRDLVAAVRAGQRAVKDATTEYLPQEPAELDEDYQRRLDRSLFLEFYGNAERNLTGLVFKQEPQLGEDVDERIVKLFENIDNAGTHGSVFLRRAFRKLFDGHVFLVAEMPAPITTEEGDVPATVPLPAAKDRRPYAKMYRAEDALNWRWGHEEGKTYLRQITFREIDIEDDGAFGETEVTRYRVYRKAGAVVEWELWEEQEGDNGAVVVVVVASGTITATRGEIPVAWVIGEERDEAGDVFYTKPPLLNLAQLNLNYYVKDSDLSNLEHHCSVPILAVEGRQADSTEISIGGNQLLDVPSGGKAYWVEHTGAALGFLKERLADREKLMMHYGLELLQDTSRMPLTATEVSLTFVQRTSKLAAMARSLKDATERTFGFFAMYLGVEDFDAGGSFSLGVEDDELALSPEDMRVYSEMVDRGQLTARTFWQYLLEANRLPEDFDAEAEEKALKLQAENAQELLMKRFDAGDLEARQTMTDGEVKETTTLSEKDKV